MDTKADVSRENAIDVYALALQLWRRRLWVFACVLVVGAAFAVYAFVAHPIYRASTVLVPASQDRNQFGSGSGVLGQLGGLASLAGVNIGSGDSETEEAIAVLNSRHFIEAFIVDNKLMPVLFPKDGWLASLQGPPTISRACKVFSKQILSVTPDKKTSLITLAVDWRNREEAARWANEIVTRINAEMRTRAIEKANASVQYLRVELEQTSDVGTRDAVNRLIEAQIKQRMIANVNHEYSFRVVDRAVVPELIDKVKPKRTLLIAAGCFLGFLVSIGIVLVVDRKLLR